MPYPNKTKYYFKFRPFRDSKKGFSLIEVIFAFFILSIGLGALFALFSPALRMGQEARQLSRLAFFAQEKLEDIKTEDVSASGNTSSSGNEFTWNIWAEPLTLAENVTLQKVSLHIQREDVARKQLTEEFVTYRLE